MLKESIEESNIGQSEGQAEIALGGYLAAAADFLESSEANRPAALGGIRIYDPPIGAVASAEDPLFEGLKDPKAVGPIHRSPIQWLPGARSVLSLFFPFSKELRISNRNFGLPSFEWLYGRIEGQSLLTSTLVSLEKVAAAKGGTALAPCADARIEVIDRKCNWSERHVAYIAGLGTFSLSRALITKAGAAGRLGSILLEEELAPTVRPYSGLEDYCTRCGACIARCPPGVISAAGKDNAACSAYLDGLKIRFAPRYGCGKCQTSTPCESGIPPRRTEAREGAAV